jgi:hypothetical protein
MPRLQMADSESIPGMDSQDTFFKYYGQFLIRWLKDSYEWPRDNGFVAGIMAVLPPLVVFLRDHTFAIDWKLFWTTLFLYGILIAAYLLIQAVRTPWKLDRERSKDAIRITSENAELLQQKRDFDETRPNIVLREPEARHVQTLSLGDGHVVILTAQFVKVRFVNKPAKNSPSAIAHGVSAKVKFLNDKGHLVLEMDGRWDDSDQPSLRHSAQSKRDLLLADFGIEEERNLDIAFRDPSSNTFVAFNNDNYNYQNVKKPEHILVGDRFTAEIKLVGVHVDTTFSVEFAAGGTRGDVAIVDRCS